MSDIKNIFGKHPIICIFTLIILCIWPILVFYKYIIFNPAKFTEEYLKIFINSIILFLIIKYYSIKIEKYNLINTRSDSGNILKATINKNINEIDSDNMLLHLSIFNGNILSNEEIEYIKKYFNNLKTSPDLIRSEDTNKLNNIIGKVRKALNNE